MHIAIFGGSFNPPTLAHEAIIRFCLALPQFEQVWVLPSGDRADKHMSAADDDRLQMLRLMQRDVFTGDPRLVISDFELRLPRPTETYQTAEALQRAYPGHSFTFIFGADAYQTMPMWKHGEELQANLSMLVFGRGTTEHFIAPNVDYYVFAKELGDISSTVARQALAVGGTAPISQSVMAYIKRHGLYQASS
jgi:nicotinate-nucleotide adenylyltransferase